MRALYFHLLSSAIFKGLSLIFTEFKPFRNIACQCARRSDWGSIAWHHFCRNLWIGYKNVMPCHTLLIWRWYKYFCKLIWCQTVQHMLLASCSNMNFRKRAYGRIVHMLFFDWKKYIFQEHFPPRRLGRDASPYKKSATQLSCLILVVALQMSQIQDGGNNICDLCTPRNVAIFIWLEKAAKLPIKLCSKFPPIGSVFNLNVL